MFWIECIENIMGVHVGIGTLRKKLRINILECILTYDAAWCFLLKEKNLESIKSIEKSIAYLFKSTIHHLQFTFTEFGQLAQCFQCFRSEMDVRSVHFIEFAVYLIEERTKNNKKSIRTYKIFIQR